MSTHTSVSKQRLAVSDSLLSDGIPKGLFTHAGYALAVGGTVVAQQAFGAASTDTIFDLASLTKPMAAATCALQLAERGQLHLRQSVGRFFEEDFGPLPHLLDVEIHHLLTHTSGLLPIPRGHSGNGTSREDVVKNALSTPVSRLPGQGYTYSDTGYILLGEIAARARGTGLDAAFTEDVAQRLGLKQTGYRGSGEPSALIAPTGSAHPPGVVHDPRARDMGGVAGHAGLFGTVSDALTYAEAIRTGGGPVLSRASAARMAVSQIARAVGGQSYGWFCPGNDFLPQGDLFSDRSFGHSGFTGCAILIDPTYDLSLVLLTNRVINEDEDGSRFLHLRRRWLNTVAAAVV